MANDTATIAMDGTMPTGQFVSVVHDFDELIAELTDEISTKSGVEWLVDDLEYVQDRPYSTARATFRGEAPDIESIERVVQAYANVGRALARHDPFPYSDAVRSTANDLISVLNGKIVAIRFETSNDEWMVSTQPIREPNLRALTAYGSIEGRVETLTRRKGLRFTLYDTLGDRGISCYLQDDDEAKMRDIWGKRVIVEGWVSRDPLTGRPTSIRQILNIVPVEDGQRGSYRNARGVLPALPGDLAPEDAIRRLRDAK